VEVANEKMLLHHHYYPGIVKSKLWVIKMMATDKRSLSLLGYVQKELV
jgi:hypothetical protein